MNGPKYRETDNKLGLLDENGYSIMIIRLLRPDYTTNIVDRTNKLDCSDGKLYEKKRNKLD